MAITMSGIKSTLGSTSNSLRAYSAQAGFTVPDRMSEFTGYTPPTPPPPAPTVYQITECAGSRTEYVTLGGSSIGMSVSKVYKFSDAALPGCWLVQNTGGSTTFSNVTATTEYTDCTACNPPTPPPPTPTPPPPTPTPPPPTPTPPPPTPTPPPTPPSVTVTPSFGCSGGSMFINLSATTSNPINTPSYVWIVTTNSGTDFTNSANYTSSNTNSGLSNATYFVGAYDTANSVYSVTTVSNQGCTTPPPPPTPTPPPPPTPSCYYYYIYALDAYSTVNGTYTNCAGFTDFFSFYNDSEYGNIVGSICVQSGGYVEVTSQDGYAESSLDPC